MRNGFAPTPPHALRMARWLWLTAAIVALDRLTKILAEQWLIPRQPVPILPLLDFTLLYNEGAAFSLLAQAGGWQRWLFVGFAVVAVLVLTAWLLHLPRGERLHAAALALIIGGAAGNLIDRIVTGRVIDFIDFYLGDWEWPAFSVADSAITIGVTLLLIATLREPRIKKSV